MAWAVVDGDRVVNLVVTQTGDGFVEVPDGTQIGASWNGTEWVPPVAPTPDRLVYVVDFWMRFTPSERIGIHASQDPVVQDLVRTLALFTMIDLNAPMLVDGMGYLAYAGLLSAVRAAEILS